MSNSNIRLLIFNKADKQIFNLFNNSLYPLSSILFNAVKIKENLDLLSESEEECLIETRNTVNSSLEQINASEYLSYLAVKVSALYFPDTIVEDKSELGKLFRQMMKTDFRKIEFDALIKIYCFVLRQKEYFTLQNSLEEQIVLKMRVNLKNEAIFEFLLGELREMENYSKLQFFTLRLYSKFKESNLDSWSLKEEMAAATKHFTDSTQITQELQKDALNYLNSPGFSFEIETIRKINSILEETDSTKDRVKTSKTLKIEEKTEILAKLGLEADFI